MALWSRAEREFYDTLEHEADLYARTRRAARCWQRTPGSAYTDADGQDCWKQDRQWGDPVSSTWYRNQVDSPAFVAWQSIIPSARALLYLSDPFRHRYVVSASGEEIEVDSNARRAWTVSLDGVAIRSRASVMSHLVAERVKHPAVDQTSPGSSNGGHTISPVRWLSVACGTALPAMRAAITAGLAPEMILVDLDRAALQQAETLAAQIRFPGQITTLRRNIFEPSTMEALRDDLESSTGLPGLIDMMGIFEYTGDTLGVDPVGFLRNAWECLAPGGMLITAQMRADRPRTDFVFGVIQWPWIEMRTADEFMGIVQAAGIAPRQVDLYLPSDGVYMVAAIHKQP